MAIENLKNQDYSDLNDFETVLIWILKKGSWGICVLRVMTPLPKKDSVLFCVGPPLMAKEG
jgi:hypothetical protein